MRNLPTLPPTTQYIPSHPASSAVAHREPDNDNSLWCRVARAWREGEEGGEGLPGGCVREHLALQVSVPYSTKHRFQQHETCFHIPVKSPYFVMVTQFRHERLVLGGGDEIRVFATLKVDGNEKRGGSGRTQ
jgi:hypothetical protein